jgi:hypothetical protein
MALQMEGPLSGNVGEFGGFDGMESGVTCASMPALGTRRTSWSGSKGLIVGAEWARFQWA